MRKIEIIEETAKFYNSNNRAANEDNLCYYSKDDKFCAVGRCMTSEALAHYGGFSGNVMDLAQTVARPFESYLKSQYRGHSVRFWRDLQQFHDYESNWNEDGLSEAGEMNKKALIEEYNDQD